MNENKEINNSLKKRLLILEDDLVTVNVLLRLLKNQYDIDDVNNGEDALKMANKNNYDAFLIDIALPGNMNGIDATKELKKIKDNREKPYIAITAYALPGDKAHFLTNGLTHYISKPFEFKTLLRLIENAIEETKKTDVKK
jgi:CheY-like chemotaxis protein